MKKAGLFSEDFISSQIVESNLTYFNDILLSPDKLPAANPRYIPFANRTPLDCSWYENNQEWDLCNPCGQKCEDSLCSNNFCAVGCADRDIEERLDTYYAADSDDQRTDFNFCHPLWKKHFIPIDLPNQGRSKQHERLLKCWS